MGAAARPASGQVIWVAIDQRSIRKLEAWPWPRETHAELLDRLIELGAAEVFLDIDFSSPSVPQSDDRFAASLLEAGGKAILPAFKQRSGVGPYGMAEEQTLPIEPFRRHAWLATANIRPEGRGRVWTYPWGGSIEGTQLGSAAAVIAGRSGPADEAFFINYAIDPQTVPKYSVIDVLDGNIERSQVKGRSIVVGADAAGLRDNISVPVRGIISGALIHILAAETLIADIAPVLFRTELGILLIALIAGSIATSPLGKRPFALIVTLSAASLALETAAFITYTRQAVVIPTSAFHTLLFFFPMAIAMRELDLRHWLAHGLRVDARNTSQLLKQVFSASSDAILVVDEKGSILEMNGRAHALFPAHGNDREGPKYKDVLPEELSMAASEAMASLRLGNATQKKTVSFYHGPDKETYLDCSISPSHFQYRGRHTGTEDPNVIAFIAIQDGTYGRRQRAQLEYLVRYDALTGVLNRRGFLQDLHNASVTEGFVVLVINFRRFRAINRTFGRAVGDAVLRSAAARLESAAPDPSLIARLGGDTLAAAYPSIGMPGPSIIAGQVLSALEDDIEVDDMRLSIRATVGVAQTVGGEDAALVVERALTAIDVAHELGGANPSYFEQSMVVPQNRARRIEKALWQASIDHEFYLVYQPYVSLKDGRVIGAQASVRWDHPEMGSIDPREFMPIAEGCAFAGPLGRWVLRRACDDAATWPRGIPVSLGVSVHQLELGRLEEDVRFALRESRLSPNQLELEVREETLMAGPPGTREAFAAIREIGASLALDDFDGGASFHKYLSWRSFNKVKLNPVLVRGLIDDSRTDAMVSAVISVCSSWGLELVCKGVETSIQKGRLVELGCEQAQGLHFGRPMILADFRDWVRAHDNARLAGAAAVVDGDGERCVARTAVGRSGLATRRG